MFQWWALFLLKPHLKLFQGDDYVTYCVVNPAGQVEVHLGNNPAGQKSNQAAGEVIDLLINFKKNFSFKANEGGVLEMLESKATEDGIFCRVRERGNTVESLICGSSN